MKIETIEVIRRGQVNKVKCDYCGTQYEEGAYSDNRPRFYSCYCCNKDLCPKHRWTIDLYNHNTDNSRRYPNPINPGFWYCLPCVKLQVLDLKES